MPRWDWILVTVLALATAGWGISVLFREPGLSEQRRAVYQAECPEYVAAARSAFAGYGVDETPPESVYTRKLDEWRSGELNAVRCQALFVQTLDRENVAPVLSYDGVDAATRWMIGPPSATASSMSAVFSSQLFELLYYRWRATGEGLEELEAMARAMEHERVESALWQLQFDEDARFTVALNDDMTISADDPGYRFLKLAKPNTPETEPPV